MTNVSSSEKYTLPFGQELKIVKQVDTNPKKIFVLGVYASAIHAKWFDSEENLLIKALAVASEPSIFWTGNIDEAKKIIDSIQMPSEFGSLVPASQKFNGPSGRSLNEKYLYPLKLTRKDAWLCDLVPFSCQNPSQNKALKREYDPRMKALGLPDYFIPKVPSNLATDKRVKEIMHELEQSRANTIILLGDAPVKHFLSKFTSQYKKLSDFKVYGKPVKIAIHNKTYSVIALAHPRQVSKLGRSNNKWFELHNEWLKEEKDLIK